MQTRTRRLITSEIIAPLARQFADYRRDGHRMGGAAAVQAAVKKAARSHGVSFSELWSEVHRVGHEMIAAG